VAKTLDVAQNKTARIEARATAAQQALIIRGAQARNQSVSEFLLETACLEAEMAILDQRVRVVTEVEYTALQELLDRPAQPNEGLRELLSRRPSWQTAKR
jgi:uncharacterized protein (DUF1778 family)